MEIYFYEFFEAFFWSGPNLIAAKIYYMYGWQDFNVVETLVIFPDWKNEQIFFKYFLDLPTNILCASEAELSGNFEKKVLQYMHGDIVRWMARWPEHESYLR